VTTPLTGSWHHAAGVLDTSGNLYLYLDGTLVDSDTGAAMHYTSELLTIGASRLGEKNFNGSIDEVRVYSRALSADEIRAHYLRGSGYNALGAITANRFRVVNTSGSKIFEVNQTAATILPSGGVVKIGSNVIQTVDAIFGIVNFTTTYDARADRFLIANYSAEYATSGFDNENFTTRYDARADRFLIANFTSNLNTQNASLWNASGSNIYLKDQAGKVGIGKTSPTEILEVQGNIRVSGNVTGTSFSVNETATSVVLVATGNKRLILTTDPSSLT